MKQRKTQKESENLENIPSFNKVSKVAWLIINNNPINTHVFIVLNALDFIYMVLMILCIYDSQRASDFQITQLDNALAMVNEALPRFILLASVFGLHLVILLSLILLAFQKIQNNGKYLIIKIISTYFALLRTFLATFTMIIIADNLYSFRSDEEQLKFIDITIVCGLIIIILVLTYFSANFINLYIPNSLIPWSESTTYPAMVDTIFKLLIAINFIFREISGIREGLLAAEGLIKGYILLYRLKKSYIYNNPVLYQYLVQDCIILHLLILFLYSSILNSKYYYFVVALSMMPISLLLLKYLYNTFIYGNLESSLNSSDDDIKANNFIRLLEINPSLTNSNQNIILGLYYSHQLKCDKFQESLNRSLKKRYNKRICQKKEEINANEEEEKNGGPYQLSMGLTSINTLVMNNCQQKFAIEPHLVDSNLNCSTNRAGSLEFSKVDLLNSEQVNVYVAAKTKNFKKGSNQQKLDQSEIFNNDNIYHRKKSLFELRSKQKNFTEERLELIKESKSKKDKKVVIDEQKTEKMILKLLKHFSKHHLGDIQSKNLNLNIIQAYSSLKLIKNIYHAQFLLIKYSTNYNTEKYITKTKAFIHEQYFEQLIEQQAQSYSQSDDKINLQKMLDLNQLLAEFDISVNILTNAILKFWSDLYNEKNAMQIYRGGLQLSQDLIHLQKVYSEIESKQLEQSELKIYIQMAAFNKYVVFKEPQYHQEIQKYRQAIETRKISFGKQETDKEKGLILTKINLNQPMKISFINQKASKLLKYKQKEAFGLPINHLMPKLISDNHHLMVSNFLKKGSSSIINKRRMVFIKQSTEHLLPVNMQLQFNILDLKSMIVVIEQVSKDELKPFGELEDEQQFGIISLNKELFIHETSKECEGICFLNNAMLNQFSTVYNKSPQLEDIFEIDTDGQPIKILLQQGFTEFQAKIKFMELIQQSVGYSKRSHLKHINSLNGQEEQPYEDNSSGNILASQNTISHQMQTDKQIIRNASLTNIESKKFIIRIQSEYYMNKKIEQKVVYIRSNDQTTSPRTFKFGTIQSVTSQNPPNLTKNVKEFQQDGKFQKISQDVNEVLFASSHNTDELELQSMSSQLSSDSSLSNLVNSFTLDKDSSESIKVPKTLRFVLQLVVFVVLLILTTSSVSLVLISSNFEAINMSIKMSNYSIARLNCITQVRLIMRVLVNIAEGYNSNANQILSDRCSFYTSLANELLEELRQSENYIDSQDIQVNKKIGKVDLEFMTSLGSFRSEQRSLSDSVQMYTDLGHDITDLIMKGGGCHVLFSYLVYFWIPILDIYQANQKERNMYFLIQNGNQDLFYKLTQFAEMYVDVNAHNIESKSSFSSYMTWICMAIIIFCFLVIVPLLGKIQERLQVMMHIFFSIDRKLKEQMIDKILEYTEMNIFKNTKEFLKQDQVQRKMRKKKHHKKKVIDRTDFDDKKKRGEFEKAMATIQEEPSQEENEKDDSDLENSKEKTTNIQKPFNIVEERSQMVYNFKQQIYRKKVKQSFGIMLIMAGLIAYFLGTYFMSQESFAEMSESVDALFILLQRKSCTENVIHAIVEGYQWNDTYLINHGKDEIMQYFIDKCMHLERSYQKKVVTEQPAFLESVKPYLRSLEDGSFCDHVFEDGDGFAIRTVTPQNCKSIMGGITKLGVTNIFSTVYTQAQQYQLSYYSAFEKSGVRDFNFIIGGMKAASVYLDLVTTIVTKPQRLLASRVVNSLENYFNGQLANFYIFYSCFVCIICIFTFIFFFSKFISNWLIFGVGIFRKMRKEMILSNKMLYVIDFELITQQERDNISAFLSKY